MYTWNEGRDAVEIAMKAFKFYLYFKKSYSFVRTLFAVAVHYL